MEEIIIVEGVTKKKLFALLIVFTLMVFTIGMCGGSFIVTYIGRCGRATESTAELIEADTIDLGGEEALTGVYLSADKKKKYLVVIIEKPADEETVEKKPKIKI